MENAYVFTQVHSHPWKLLGAKIHSHDCFDRCLKCYIWGKPHEGRSATGLQNLSAVPLLRATDQEQKSGATRVISHIMGSFSISLTHWCQ